MSRTPARPKARSGSFLTILSVMILIGVEVFGVALAGGWALAGLFELGETAGYALMGLFSLFGLYIMVQLWHRAHAAEAGR
jgi:hypothetical protein